MFDAIRARLARRRALKWVARRKTAPWAADLSVRRVLVVVSAGDEFAREAWAFIDSLDLVVDRVLIIVRSGELTYVKAEYVRRVVRMDDQHLDAVGLPKKEFAQWVWEHDPNVAFCFTPTFDLAAAALVGASPAALRVGIFGEEAEPFFDLMVVPESSARSAFGSLLETLRHITPPVLALSAQDAE